MKKCVVLLLALLGLLPIISIAKGKDCLGIVSMSRLREAVAQKSEFYGDLPDRIDCKKPNASQAKLCTSDVLRFMERLDNMATTYAYENATGQERDHQYPMGIDWLQKTLRTCQSAECLCSAYKENAESSLGGISPYAKP